jgi:uncharacterized membrane protein
MAITLADKSRETADFLAGVLRIGVLTAASVVVAGGVVYIARHAGEQQHYAHFALPQGEETQIRGILSGITQGRGRGLIRLGLLLLIATPVARVFFSVLLFLWAGDRLYAAIASFVLAVLILSLARG